MSRDLLLLGEVTRQAVLPLLVRVSGLLAGHVVDPPLVALETALAVLLDADLVPLRSKVEPAEGVTDRADLVRDTCRCGMAHLLVELRVAEELHQVARDSLPVTGSDEEAVDAVLDLQGDTASLGSNDWSSGMQSLRDLHLEALAGGELEHDVSLRDHGVEELIVGFEAHDTDVLGQVRVVGLDLTHGLVVDHACVGVVDRTIAADHKLGDVGNTGLLALAAELRIRVDDSRNAFCRVESGYLNDVLARGPIQLRPVRLSVSRHLEARVSHSAHMR